MICPNCGQDAICKNCGYSEPDLFMKSHHDFETEIALAENVREQMPDLWDKINHTVPLYPDSKHWDRLIGPAYVYKLTKPTPNAPSGRVVRILYAIYKARGNTFSRPKNYTERRDSDKRTLKGYKAAHRIRDKKHDPSQQT